MNQIGTLRISTISNLLSNRFWNFYMIGFACMTAAQEILSISALVYVGVAMCFIGLLLADPENMRSLFVFFILFNSEEALYVVNVVFSVVFIAKTYRNIKITPSIKMVGLLITWELLHAVTYIIYKYEFIYFIQQFGFALVMFANILLIIQTDIKKEYERLAHVFIFSTVASCAIFWINYIQYFGAKYAFSFSAGIGRVSSGVNSFKKNPNMVSRSCAFAFALLLSLMLIRWAAITMKRKILYLICLLLIVFFGMMSGSTSFYLGVAISVVWMFLSILHDYPGGKAIVVLYTMLMGLLLAVIIIFSYAPLAVKRLTNDLNADDVSNGRTIMWAYYGGLFKKYIPFFLMGVGLQDYFRKVAEWTGEDVYATHNVMFEVMVSWGFIGTVILGILFYVILKETKLVKKNRCYISYIPALTILLVSQTGNFFYGYYTNMIFISLAVFGVSYMNWYYEETS